LPKPHSEIFVIGAAAFIAETAAQAWLPTTLKNRVQHLP
jgi:hypothetical protein